MTTFEFIRNLLIGTSLTLLNLIILLKATRTLFPYLQREIGRYDHGTGKNVFVKPLAIVMFLIFIAHLMQFATWAAVFVAIGQFDSYTEAYYFSAVNFTSLGYGDIVMDAEWRILGPLEAANGVLMFGLSAGMLVALISLFVRTASHSELSEND